MSSLYRITKENKALNIMQSYNVLIVIMLFLLSKHKTVMQ